MKNWYILFSAHGQRETIAGCRFALLQLLHLNLEKKVTPVIFTDDPDYFTDVLRYFENFRINCLNADQLKKWKGKYSFESRSAIEMIKDFFKENNGSILYCENDTYVRKDVESIFKNLDQQKVCLHSLEGKKTTNPESKKWNNFFRRQPILYDGNEIQNAGTIRLWDTSVIGLNHSSVNLLDDVLILMDTISEKLPKTDPGQVAVSYVFQKNSEVFSAEEGIFHYPNLTEYQILLEEYFRKTKLLPREASNELQSILPEKIISDKKVFFKTFPLSRIFKKKWDIHQYMPE